MKTLKYREHQSPAQLTIKIEGDKACLHIKERVWKDAVINLSTAELKQLATEVFVALLPDTEASIVRNAADGVSVGYCIPGHGEVALELHGNTWMARRARGFDRDWSEAPPEAQAALAGFLADGKRKHEREQLERKELSTPKVFGNPPIPQFNDREFGTYAIDSSSE